MGWWVGGCAGVGGGGGEKPTLHPGSLGACPGMLPGAGTVALVSNPTTCHLPKRRCMPPVPARALLPAPALPPPQINASEATIFKAWHPDAEKVYNTGGMDLEVGV